MNRTGFGVTMAFMVIAFVMAFVLKYLLAKYPYPELQPRNVDVSHHQQQIESDQKD
jgi:hypothetical protein